MIEYIVVFFIIIAAAAFLIHKFFKRDKDSDGLNNCGNCCNCKIKKS
ncbi:MAG TPA: FeoB-associated Cys-rich membrane protein [bacterium]|nr:FeoB-associated Cys-rich membrane protein [bacterium]HPP87815.1 FeoB-associated Cys-rich membrane protein [bacterium]